MRVHIYNMRTFQGLGFKIFDLRNHPLNNLIWTSPIIRQSDEMGSSSGNQCIISSFMVNVFNLIKDFNLMLAGAFTLMITIAFNLLIANGFIYFHAVA